MYSHYKGCYTVKVHVTITPNGMVSFLSKAYGGRASNSFITNDWRFSDKLEFGDEVPADKGFSGTKDEVDGQKSILVCHQFCTIVDFLSSAMIACRHRWTFYNY